MARPHPLPSSALALSLVLLSRFGAAEVLGDPRYLDPPPRSSSLVPMGEGGRVRDGACFKLGVGTAVLGIDRVVRNDEQREASTVRAAGALFEIYIGGSLQRDTTLGALILSQSFGRQTLSVPDADRGLSQLQVGFFGAAVRHYFWPDLGFSASFGLGFTNITAQEEGEETQSVGGPGAGVTLSAGYDFWLSREFALGLDLRGVAAGFSGRSELEVVGGRAAADDRGAVFSGAISLGLTYY